MRRSLLVLVCLALAGGFAMAQDKKPKKEKEKPAAKSDKNVFQKSESSIGDWANRNKIWITRKKGEKANKD